MKFRDLKDLKLNETISGAGIPGTQIWKSHLEIFNDRISFYEYLCKTTTG